MLGFCFKVCLPSAWAHLKFIPWAGLSHFLWKPSMSALISSFPSPFPGELSEHPFISAETAPGSNGLHESRCKGLCWLPRSLNGKCLMHSIEGRFLGAENLFLKTGKETKTSVSTSACFSVSPFRHLSRCAEPLNRHCQEREACNFYRIKRKMAKCGEREGRKGEDLCKWTCTDRREKVNGGRGGNRINMSSSFPVWFSNDGKPFE